MALTQIESGGIKDDAVGVAQLSATGTADSTKFLRGDNSWQVVAVPTLDAPVITGDLVALDTGTITHTITNYSASCQYTITPTNCTIGSVSASGTLAITATSHAHPSYTIKATSNSLGLEDSTVVTKTFTEVKLTPPTINSPIDASINTNVVYTITSATTNDDKLILDIGSSNFSYQSVSHGSGSKVGNTVEVTGFSTNNPAVTIQLTATATYSVKAKAQDTGGDYADSDYTAVDSITAVDPPYNVDYLVIAGGGGGGVGLSGGAGGGGAGGYRNSYNSESSGGGASSETALSLTPSTVYTITVGAGGAAGSQSGTVTWNGANSSIVGSDITDIVSTGGGGGTGLNWSGGGQDGADGGSGGGSGYVNSDPGAGTSGQGYAGGDEEGESHWVGGGGGGAAEAGSTDGDGYGGDGLASSITGSSVTRAGGGGGSCNTTPGEAPGGDGGGGKGWDNDADSTKNATANTGSGGGGVGNGGVPAGTGGSGIVILRMATSDYSGTQSGGTVTTDSSDTIISYTTVASNHTYTA